MPVVAVGSTSLAAGANSGNALQGKPFEFVSRAFCRLAIVGSAAGLTVQVLNGSEIIAQNEGVPLSTDMNIREKDHYHIKWIARGRQQLIVTNPTGGAINYAFVLEFQPV